MKHLLMFSLLMAVLCLPGCSSEEEPNPQNVSFSVEEISVGPDGERVNIVIEANCPWTITDEKNMTYTEIRQGKGTVNNTLVVFANPSYKAKQYIVTVISEDGTSSDSLTIVQGGAFGMEVGKADPIAAEGGLIEIPVRTNDQIDQIETPDWISFTESRSLTGYTYTFEASPNKTGSPRYGAIKLKGKNTMAERIGVEQDSYEPIGVVIERLPAKTIGEELTASVQLEPTYADWGKIRISSSENLTCLLDKGLLNVTLLDYGIHTIDFLKKNSNKILRSASIERFPKQILVDTEKKNLYVGEEVKLNTVYNSEDYIYSTSVDNVVLRSDDGMLTAKTTGTTVLTVEHPELLIKDSINIEVSEVRLTAFVDSYLDWSTAWSVEIATALDGKNITQYTFGTSDFNQGVVMPQDVKSGEYAEGRDRVVYRSNIGIYADSLDELKEKVKNVVVDFVGTVDGKEVKASTHVLFQKPEWLH